MCGRICWDFSVTSPVSVRFVLDFIVTAKLKVR